MALIEKMEEKSRHKFRIFLWSLEKYQTFVMDHLEEKMGISIRKEFQVHSEIEPEEEDYKEQSLKGNTDDFTDLTTHAPADMKTFFKAIRQGEQMEVKRLLSSGVVDVNCRGEKGRTPVMIAAWYRQGAIFDFLLKSNCDLSAVSDTSNNVLHYACLEGSEYIVKMLLDKHKLDIECRGQFGRTPLMFAVEKGHISVVEMLEKKGADFKTVDGDNNNILHLACVGGHVDMVEYVLSLNITDIECRGIYGRTPLMCAVEKGHMSVVEILKKEGADFNKVDNYNDSILHVACIGGHVDMVQYVLSLKIPGIECRGRYGRTPLMCAVEKGHTSVVEILKKEGADSKTVDGNHNNILHVACLGGHVDMVQFVRSLNITDLECRGHYGRTPMLHAVEKGHLKLVQFLEKEGADFNTVDDDNNYILHMACLGGHADMVQYVLSLNITDIECRGQHGRTPLMCAVGKGHLSVVETLKMKAADFHTVDDNNNNVLHMACLGGHVDMVQYVLSLNITDTECRGTFGRTPLMIAADKGHLKLVSYLKTNGADINVVDDYKANILHVACMGGHVDMVKHLVSLEELMGFERRKDEDGDTPLQVALDMGHDDVASFLQSRMSKD